MKKSEKTKRILFFIVMGLLFLSLASSILMLILAPSESNDVGIRTKSDHGLVIFQCLLGVLCLFLPSIINKKKTFEIPNYIIIIYTLFLLGSVYLGNIANFYYKVKNWDLFMHSFSGAMLALLGFSVIALLNKNNLIKLNKFFIIIFSFCFVMAIGVLWEVFEYVIDSVFKDNMQRFALEDGTLLIGQEALKNTMQDLISNSIGAAVACGVVGIASKKDGAFLDKVIIKKSSRNNEVTTTAKSEMKENESASEIQMKENESAAEIEDLKPNERIEKIKPTKTKNANVKQSTETETNNANVKQSTKTETKNANVKQSRAKKN